jgi:hypothetical protein
MRILQGGKMRTTLAYHAAIAVTAALILTGLPASRAAALNDGPLNGNFPGYVTTNTTADDANRCAVNPVNDVASALIAAPNYVLAYHSGASAPSVPAPTFSDPLLGGYGNEHRQGIQRFHRNGKNYLLVSNSAGYPDIPGFEVIELGSRGETREALGGNAQPQGWPSDDDRIVHYAESFDPAEFPDKVIMISPVLLITRHWNHSGGFQVMGHYVALPLEHLVDVTTAGFRVADLSDPTSPIWGEFHFKQRVALTDAGAVALTRLNDRKYMVMVFGHGSDNVEVFVSTETAMPEFGSASSTWES